jgi:Zn-finger nucleic acid-binding protein
MTDEPIEEFRLDEIAEGQRPCPVCGSTMQVQRKQGISIDVCPEHGIWLDDGELEKIVKSIRTQMGSRHRRSLQRARRGSRSDGVVAGSIFGFWALLWD